MTTTALRIETRDGLVALAADDGRRLLRYRMPELGLSRTAALSRLEFATLRFALDRSKKREPDAETRALVEEALHRLGAAPGMPPEVTSLVE